MKRLVFISLLVLTLNVSAQEITWITLEEAVELQKKEPKKIIMDFYTKWCGPCKMLDKNTFSNKDVASYISDNYYAVKFNAEGNDFVYFNGREFTNPNYDPEKANKRNSSHQLSQYFQVRAYPSIVYLNENAELITKIPGYQTPQQLELYLKMFANNDHLNIKTQEDFNSYYQSFKAEFN